MIVAAPELGCAWICVKRSYAVLVYAISNCAMSGAFLIRHWQRARVVRPRPAYRAFHANGGIEANCALLLRSV